MSAATKISLATESRGEIRETPSARYDVHRTFLPLLVMPRRRARLLTSGYTEILLLSRRKKKSAKPLRAQSEYRFAASRFGARQCHTMRRSAHDSRGVGERRTWPPHVTAARDRCGSPRVPRRPQFPLNIVISCNVLCRFFPTTPPSWRFPSYFYYSPD